MKIFNYPTSETLKYVLSLGDFYIFNRGVFDTLTTALCPVNFLLLINTFVISQVEILLLWSRLDRLVQVCQGVTGVLRRFTQAPPPCCLVVVQGGPGQLLERKESGLTKNDRQCRASGRCLWQRHWLCQVWLRRIQLSRYGSYTATFKTYKVVHYVQLCRKLAPTSILLWHRLQILVKNVSPFSAHVFPSLVGRPIIRAATKSARAGQSHSNGEKDDFELKVGT